MGCVLCFGDSLTWGHDPVTAGRHAFGDRWPNALAAGLPGIEVIAEGLRGRATCRDNGASVCDTNGARILPVLLATHAPVDLVIVMLGTNDIWQGFRPDQVAAGLRRIVEIIRTHPMHLPEPHITDILLLAPPPMVAGADPVVTEPLITASRELARVTEMVATENALRWIDMAEVAEASELDSVHIDAAGTRAMGEALIAPVRDLLAARRK